MYKKCLFLAFLAVFLLPIHSSNAQRSWLPGEAPAYPKGEILRFVSMESWVAVVFRGDSPDQHQACKFSTLWDNDWGSNIIEMIKMAGPNAIINPQYSTAVPAAFGDTNPQTGSPTLAEPMNTMAMCGITVVSTK